MAMANKSLALSTDFLDFSYRAGSAADLEKPADLSVFGRREKIDLNSTLSAVAASELPVSSGEQELMHFAKPSPVERKSSEWEAIVQTWEGRVVSDDPEAQEFVAIIRDLTCKTNPEEEVVIGYESVLASDVSLIEEGAVFFWNIGRYRKYSESTGKQGPSKHKFEIRFRRLPPLSADRLSEILEISKRMSERLHAN